MAYEQLYPNEKKEKWTAFIFAFIVTSIMIGCVFGVRSCARKSREAKSKTEQVTNNFIQPKDIVAYNKIKTY